MEQKQNVLCCYPQIGKPLFYFIFSLVSGSRWKIAQPAASGESWTNSRSPRFCVCFKNHSKDTVILLTLFCDAEVRKGSGPVRKRSTSVAQSMCSGINANGSCLDMKLDRHVKHSPSSVPCWAPRAKTAGLSNDSSC
jgi:hypothetical protein